MPLPQAIRSRIPDDLRDHAGLRAAALATGLIGPRPMISSAEGALLERLAGGAHTVVEIGVYEGSSALVLCQSLSGDAELHLIDPFIDEAGTSIRFGWRANPTATRLAIWRAVRRRGPRVRWHIARSQDVGREWTAGPVDLLFVDGDHSLEGCREDWEVWHRHIRPGGLIAFHDARGNRGSPGPTAVVNELFRGPQPHGWRIVDEVDRMVVVQRDRDSQASAGVTA